MLDNVVLIHGLWMMGADMSLLRRRIRKQHFAVHQFSYPTLRSNPSKNAVLLHEFLTNLNGQTVHFVAHSLGGLVLRHLFHQYPDQHPGRVVMLGTPHTGSVVARVLAQTMWGKMILGKSIDQGLLGDVPEWIAKNQLGVIAGNRSMGAGRLIYRFSDDNDGTVAVAETHLDHITDHLILPTTHTGLIFNKEVAAQTCQFLKLGYFQHL